MFCIFWNNVPEIFSFAYFNGHLHIEWGVLPPEFLPAGNIFLFWLVYISMLICTYFYSLISWARFNLAGLNITLLDRIYNLAGRIYRCLTEYNLAGPNITLLDRIAGISGLAALARQFIFHKFWPGKEFTGPKLFRPGFRIDLQTLFRCNSIS